MKLDNKVFKGELEPYLIKRDGYHTEHEKISLTGLINIITGGPKPGKYYQMIKLKRKYFFFGPLIRKYSWVNDKDIAWFKPVKIEKIFLQDSVDEKALYNDLS